MARREPWEFGPNSLEMREMHRIVEEGSAPEVEPDSPAAFAAHLVDYLLSHTPDQFAEYMGSLQFVVQDMAEASPDVVKAMVLCYKSGIAAGSGICANDLGAMYYSGWFVEQSYKRAKELYEVGSSLGCSQALVNLGYIHEYGRVGKQNLTEAFRCYSVAAALEQHWEALYKLGDLYSQGKGVRENLRLAKSLWEKSLAVAEGPEQRCQPGIRIANAILSERCRDFGLVPDALRALELYQEAELGLRESLDRGLEYYRPRLAEAIAGQSKARAILDGEMPAPGPDSSRVPQDDGGMYLV